MPFPKDLRLDLLLGPGMPLDLSWSEPPGVPGRPEQALAGCREALTCLLFPSSLTVPGEVPRDPALQVRKPAAHPARLVVLGGAERPVPSRPQFPCLPFLTPAVAPPAPSLCSFCLMRGCLLGWVVNVGSGKAQGIWLKDPSWEK